MSLRRWYKSSPRLRRASRRVKNAVTYRAVRGVVWCVDLLSLERALALADRVGDLAFFVFRGTRRLAVEHLDVAFGDDLKPTTRQQIARASFRNLARCFCELVKFDTIRERLDEYVDVEGWEHVETVLAEGKGAVAITGHIGNWELLAAYFSLRGVPVAAIARRIYEPRINSMLIDFRNRHGVKTILRESPSSGREILEVLRAKGILAMLIDQDTRVQSLSVPFFGRLARTPVAAAALAVKRDLPAVPVFAQRRPTGGHRIIILPPIEQPRSGNAKRDIGELTRLFSRTLEARIRKNPAEWVWWHRRWRHAPIPRLDVDAEFQ